MMGRGLRGAGCNSLSHLNFLGVDAIRFEDVNGEKNPGISFFINDKRWLVYFTREAINLYIDGEGSIWGK